MNITIYKKTRCPWAAAVEAFLDAKDIKYELKDITANPEYKDEVEKATGQSKSPTLNIDGKWLADASVEDVDEAVGN